MTAMTNFIPFARPDISELEVEAVSRVLRSGILTGGEQTARFESMVAIALGGGVEVVATNSGTAALHLALLGAGIGKGDEVILPTLTFAATIEAVVMAGATPVLVDVDSSRNIDVAMVAEAITPKTKAIVPVHMGGVPADLERLSEIAGGRLAIVEDAAHAFGSTYRGGKIGSKVGSLKFANLTAFSFYPTKPITAGEGGCIVTTDSKIADYCRRVRLHGISVPPGNASWNYEIGEMGYKYNMSEIQAAIGIVQLAKAEPMRRRREAIARSYDEAFANLPVIRPPVVREEKLSWHLYSIELPDRIPRSSFLSEMSKQGIACSVHYKPLHLHPYWAEFGGWERERFPVACSYWQRCVSLPIYSTMSESNIAKVIEAVRICLSRF